MIDPMTSLAFSVYSGKGVYALLLGSGVSRASGIMTGWDIVQDLIRKLATVEGKDCGESPADWYEATYGKEPDYSDLLEMLAKSSAARGHLLRSYFEQTEQDREEGKKAPTAAHKAIARLVSTGYARVIVTTNFDRLLEQALDAEGVIPTVISTADAVKGAVPLVHSRCTLIKVHGDYLDARLKNTRDELGKYEKPMNRLLDQIFDEYGLIVCGWSADWDTALRLAIERCPNLRFTTFWSAYSELKGAAQDVCQKRRAEVIIGRDADSFFTELADKVASLAEIGAQHPVTTPVAIATLKRYLTEDRHRIRLADFIQEEAKSAVAAMAAHPGGSFRTPFDAETTGFVAACDVQFDRLLKLLIVGSYWGKRSQGRLWLQCVERVAQAVGTTSGGPPNSSVAIYPAILLFYGCGLASLVGKRYSTLTRLLTMGRFVDHRLPMTLSVFMFNLQRYSNFAELAKLMTNQSKSNLGISNHLACVLREPFQDILPDTSDYQNSLAVFEYYNALSFIDWSSLQNANSLSWTKDWAPSGLYTVNVDAVRGAREELNRLGDRFPLLKAGLFGGSVERLQSAVSLLDEFIKTVRIGSGLYH
jgi:hypothetical protein